MHIFLPAFFCGVLVFLLAGEPQTVEKRLNSLDSPRSQRDDQVFPAQLILEMMTVAIRQGASLPRACEAVGMAMKTDLGSCLCQISQSLYRGASWEDAWGLSRSLPSQMDRQTCDLLEQTLESSWRHGASPIIRIETAIEEENRLRSRAMDDAASKLSVKVLLPLGLCFLPAFVILTVIPSLAGWIGTMWL